MPNHITNKLELIGTQSIIDKCLVDIKCDDKAVGTIDFNKIIPMPASLNMEAGSYENHAILAYMKVANPGKPAPDIGPEHRLTADKYSDVTIKLTEKFYTNDAAVLMEKIENFAFAETDDRNKLITDGETYVRNLIKYGTTTWYDWCIANWNTKWNAYNFGEFKNNTVVFHTAWSNIEPIIKTLSKRYPDIRFKYAWADEDMGANVGELEIVRGEIQSVYYPDTFSKNAYEMAADIRGVDLADYNLYFNENTGTYKYREECNE